MRICIDIDGTICPPLQPCEAYQNLKPLRGAGDKIRLLKEQGNYIIFYTARHMRTCDSNIGQVIARQGHVLIEWLAKHGFVYDELWFGKPYAHIYIDDRAFRFRGSWEEIDDPLLKSYL